MTPFIQACILRTDLTEMEKIFFYMHTLIEVTALDETTLNIKQVQNLCVSMDMMSMKCFRSMLPIAKLDMDIAKERKETSSPPGPQVLFRFPL